MSPNTIELITGEWTTELPTEDLALYQADEGGGDTSRWVFWFSDKQAFSYFCRNFEDIPTHKYYAYRDGYHNPSTFTRWRKFIVIPEQLQDLIKPHLLK